MPVFERIKGFTLIELIVVISLISIMLIPNIKERAAREQKRYILHVNLDSNKLWITHGAMLEEALQSAETNGYKLPEDIKLLDVEYPDQEKISVGQADIYFNEKGYSDKVIIHFENDDNEKFSFLIEPFLLRVRLYNSYAEFGD